MARRILVPLDGSDLSERVIPWADELAAAMHAEVELVRVLERDITSDALLGEVGFGEPFSGSTAADPAGVGAAEEQRPQKEARLALAHARTLFQRVQTVQDRVLEGDPAEAIVARVGEVDADLIAMATHGRTGVARTVLGSVAGAVVHKSPVPVLVVRDGLTSPARVPQRALVPLDMSDLGEAGLRAIEPLARELRLQLILFHALELPPPTLPVQGAAIPLGLPPSHTPDEVLAYLEGLAARLKSNAVDAVVQIGAGAAAEETARAAEEHGTDMIAMSTHGRTGLARWVLGSVTEGVIARANVPVLVVHPPQMPPAAAAESAHA